MGAEHPGRRRPRFRTRLLLAGLAFLWPLLPGPAGLRPGVGTAHAAEEAAPPAEGADAEGPDADGDAADVKETDGISQSISPYFPVVPLTVSVIEKKKLKGSLVVSPELELASGLVRARARRQMPVLRDAYLRALTAYVATRFRSDRPIDVSAIAATLQRVTDAELGEGQARLLIVFVMLKRP